MALDGRMHVAGVGQGRVERARLMEWSPVNRSAAPAAGARETRRWPATRRLGRYCTRAVNRTCRRFRSGSAGAMQLREEKPAEEEASMAARPEIPSAPRSLRQSAVPPAAAPRRGGLAGGVQSAWRSFSGLGLLLGAVFLALSLTPSLIPRSFPLQGALAGVSLAVGYGIGVLFGAVWTYFELPVPQDRLRRTLTWAAAALAAAIVVSFSWRAAAWQNSIRVVMDMPLVESARPFEVILVAAVVFVLLLLLGRLFGWLVRFSQRRAGRYVPIRVSRVLGIAAAVVLAVLVLDGVLLRGLLRVADLSFKTADALIEPDVAAPTDPMGTGSSASLIRWDEIGRTGRNYISAGPTAGRYRRLPRPPGDDADPGLCRSQHRRQPRGPGPARPRRTAARRRLRPLGAGGDRAHRHRLDGPRRHPDAGISARRRRRDRRRAVFLPVQPALDPRRARFLGGDRPRAVPRRLPPLDRDAQGPPPAPLPLRPQPRRLRLRAVGRPLRDDRRPDQRRALDRLALLHPAMAPRSPTSAIPARPSGCRPSATAR